MLSLIPRDRLRLELEPPVLQPLGVVADGDVAVAERTRSLDHLLERPAAVRPVRVHVQVAQVAELDEARQATVARGDELTAILTQLGRDPLVAEVPVQLLLVGRVKDVARLGVLDAVLRHDSLRRTASSRRATLCAAEPVKRWSRLP